jgi:hypothetical protein
MARHSGASSKSQWRVIPAKAKIFQAGHSRASGNPAPASPITRRTDLNYPLDSRLRGNDKCGAREWRAASCNGASFRRKQQVAMARHSGEGENLPSRSFPRKRESSTCITNHSTY